MRAVVTGVLVMATGAMGVRFTYQAWNTRFSI